MLYDVVLSGFNADEIMIIDLCMTLCNMDAAQAYAAVDSMPYQLAIGVDMKQAKKIKKAFESEGAFIDVIAASDANNANFVSQSNSHIDDNNGFETFNYQPQQETTFSYEEDNEYGKTFNNGYSEEYNNHSQDMEEYHNSDFNNEYDESNYEEEGINLEKVFSDNVNMNMIPNDYGDYSLEKLEQEDKRKKEEEHEKEKNEIKQAFEAIDNMSEFKDCTYKSDDKPAYNIKGKPSKQYISKDDLVRMERERNNNQANTFDINNGNKSQDDRGISKSKKSKKSYITKDYMTNNNQKQEIIAENDNSFLNLGDSNYNENCMQIKTERRDDVGNSKEEDMKKLYDKKALSNMTQAEEDKVSNEWISALKKTKKSSAAQNTNDYQKEQIVCPKCGSSFVSSKKSQGFFGTGKIKYICEACRFKF